MAERSRIAEIHIKYEVFDSREDLPEEDQKLLQAATEAMKHSYAPASHFHVGAALRTENGTIVDGCNIENVKSWSLTLCAERTAIFKAVALGQAANLRTLAVTGRGEGFDTFDPVNPC